MSTESRDPVLRSEESERAAEELFLDGLLLELFRPEAARRDASVARAFVELRRPEQPGFRRGPWLRRLVAAATILVVVSLGPSGPGDTPLALAAVDLLAQKAESAPDREYSVSIQGRMSTGGTLWVRGGKQFVLRLARPTGELWAGCGAAHTWLIPAPEKTPTVIVKGAWDVSPFLPRPARPPFLMLGSMLARLKHAYTVTYEAAPDGFLRLRGRRRSKSNAPSLIRVLADRASGVIHEVDLVYGRGGAIVQLRLVSEPELPKDWFDHVAHHPRGRRVVQIDPGRPLPLFLRRLREDR